MHTASCHLSPTLPPLSTDSPHCPAQEAHTVLAHRGDGEEDDDEDDETTAPVSVPVVVLVTLIIIVLIIIIYFQVRAWLFKLI